MGLEERRERRRVFQEDPRLLVEFRAGAQTGSGSAGGWAEATSVEQGAVVWELAEELRMVRPTAQAAGNTEDGVRCAVSHQ